MPFLINLILPLLPYVLGGIAILGLFLGIKRRGVLQERGRQEAAKAKQLERVNEAISKDEAIDAKTREKVNEVQKPTSPIVVGDRFKF